jgi:uncharacterized protein YkwD
MSRKQHEPYSLDAPSKRKKSGSPVTRILVVVAVALIAGVVAFLVWPSGPANEPSLPGVPAVITTEGNLSRSQSKATITLPSVNMYSSGGESVSVMTAVPSGATAAATGQVADAIIAYVNEERTAAGLSPLQPNTTLTRVAELHSAYQSQQDTLTHTGVGNSRPADRVSAAGYNWQAVGENVLQRWDTDAQEAYQQWVDSPPHHENMMNADFSEIGVGYAQHESGRVYFTMVLAHPR